MSHLTNALWIALSALLTEPLLAAVDKRQAQEDAQEGTELDRQGINTLQDISRFEPALDISRHPRFGLDKITIRGLTDRRIATEVDGIPQQDRFQLGTVFTSSRDLFDFCTLAELNVTRGPHSSRPDRSALGGVISLRLLDGMTAKLPDSRAKDDQHRRRYSLTYHWDNPGSTPLRHALFRLYEQRSDSGLYETSTYAIDRSRWTRNYRYAYRVLGARLVLDSEVDTTIHQRCSYGVDLSRASSPVMHNGTMCQAGCTAATVTGASVGVPRTRTQQYGAFVQDSLSFPGGRFVLSPSLRYDRYRITPDAGHDSIQPSMDIPLAEPGVPGWKPQTAFDRNTAPGRHIKIGVSYTF